MNQNRPILFSNMIIEKIGPRPNSIFDTLIVDSSDGMVGVKPDTNFHRTASDCNAWQDKCYKLGESLKNALRDPSTSHRFSFTHPHFGFYEIDNKFYISIDAYPFIDGKYRLFTYADGRKEIGDLDSILILSDGINTYEYFSYLAFHREERIVKVDSSELAKIDDFRIDSINFNTGRYSRVSAIQRAIIENLYNGEVSPAQIYAWADS